MFCEQCGTRLGAPAPAPSHELVCGRCGGGNPAHMRFCVHCGNTLAAPAPAAPAPVADSSYAPTPFGASPAAVVAPPSPMSAPGPICPRCQGIGDPGASRCKFCGTAYAGVAQAGPPQAAPPQAAPQAIAPQMAPTPAAAVSRVAQDVRLVAILKDGSDGAAHALQVPQTDLGRSEGELRFTDDPYLSSRHARLRFDGARWFLRDLDSVNGVYVRIREPQDLADGDRILLGQQLLRFELIDDAEIPLGPASVQGVLVFGTPEAPRFARLVQTTTEGVGRDVHYLYRDDTVLGRETGDIVFTDDPFLSRRHASIRIERSTRRVTLKDLGSSNGTALRLRREHELRVGDQFRVGRHLFRFDGHEQR